MVEILIVDAREISLSFGCESLYVNGIHVLDSCDDEDYPLHNVAENLARALNCVVTKEVLSEKKLARSMSLERGVIAEFEQHDLESDDFDDFIQGYNSDDVLRAVKAKNKEQRSPAIADFFIQDWHLSELGEGWTGPAENKDTYRFVIEQSKSTNQIYFKVYPSILDSLSDEIVQCGLSGVIEIRNGKPYFHCQ